MNVTFLSTFRADAVGKDQWELALPFIVEVEEDRIFRVITVPQFFRTDLASVPRLPLVHMLFAGRARRSATLHDWLYRTESDREYADRVFLAAMKAEGESWFTRSMMHLGVRAAGWAFWRKKPA